MTEWTKSERPTAYIVGGPNGSGKTSLLKRLYEGNPSIQILNADEIALELNIDSPEKAAIPAGRAILKLLKQLKNQRLSFAFETTLSARGFPRFLRELKASGFRIIIVFVWLRSEDLALERIRNRQSVGGHAVPEGDVRRRYVKSFHNMQNVYRHLADDWFFYDNSDNFAELVAFEQNGKLVVKNKRLFARILEEVRAYGQSTKKD